MGLINLTIRKKLLLISLVVLAIPYIGFEYIRELERYLRDSLETALLDAAKGGSTLLQQREELLPLQVDAGEKSIYVHTLEHPIQMDGYTHDWSTDLDWAEVYGNETFSFRLLAGRYQRYFYLLLQVRDEHIVYKKSGVPGALDNDHIQLIFYDNNAELNHLYLSPSAPGSIRPFRIATIYDEYGMENQSVQYITNITAEWQPAAVGYNVEIALPFSLAGERLGIIVNNVDDVQPGIPSSSLGTAGENTEKNPGRLVRSSPEIKRIIKNYDNSEGRRLWVLDNSGRVLANSGSLERESAHVPVNIVYSLVLPSISRRIKDDLAGASRLQSNEVLSALSGKTVSGWRSYPDGNGIVVSAAAPIWINETVHGVVLVEETTSSIQLQQRQAMASLLNKTLFVFIFVVLILLLFATRLSMRIRKLSNEARTAIDEHGRVLKPFAASKTKDEIGELSRNYAAMLDRLREYNDYLEKMAGRLSHEIRTPITVVQSSLDHLQPDEHSRQYLQRAREGVERLQLLVSRLSEATRLEQALQSAEKIDTDIGKLLNSCVSGYQTAYPLNRFVFEGDGGIIKEFIVPDLFVQMLDKLVANAVDFSASDKPVRIGLQHDAASWSIYVINYGPGLPASMDRQLFNSMISIRRDKTGSEPHLGLGLYIVRQIAEFHKGEISANNLADRTGVKFTIRFPGKSP